MNKSLIIGVVIITFFILGMSVFLLADDTKSSQNVVSENARAEIVEPTSFDWGTIPINGGNVTKSFALKNTGTESLRLFNVKTSCHCTVATLTIDNKTSEEFGMSGFSDWVGEVKPNNEAKLTVIFDPAFHGPQGIGPVTRYVSVETNDKASPKITFTLTGTVVK